MPRPWRLLIVCRGNTCRSPMAEVVLADAIARAGLKEAVTVASAGIAPAALGQPADPRARAALGPLGPDLDGHVTRAATAGLLAGCDEILAVDRATLVAVRERLGPCEGALTGLLGDYSGKAGPGDIADPYHGGVSDYERALSEIWACADGLIAALASRQPNPSRR